jgi:Chromosome segregation ATPases
MKIQHAKEIQQFQNEIEAEQRKSALLERETALSYAKKVQNAQNLEIERLTNDKMKTETHVRALEAKNYLLEKELEKAQFSLEQAESEVENLKAAVKDLKSTADNDKSTKSMRELMSDKEENMDHRCKVLEERLENVSRELQSSEERNSRYEEGHGLSEAIIHQKRLEADIRRREVDLKKLLIEIGEKDDKIRLLSKTCEILREQHSGDCSETIDIDTDVISKIIEEEQTALHRQNLELRHQVDELEKERNCLMRRLRENALLVGGNGLCLHGLSSEKIDLVIDFVNNLRNGRVKLPLDDKSSKLASELSSLQTIRLSDVYTIKRLERELEAMRIAQGQSAEDFFHSRYFVYLKTAVEDIQAQNKELKFEMTQLRKPKQVCIREEDYIDGVDLVPSTRKKVEVMIGRELDKNLDVCTLLNLVYDAYETVRKKFENYVMLLKTKEVIIGDYRKEINDLQSRLTNIKSATKETRPIHVQVNIDQIELKMTQFALKASERNLVSCGKRVTRLQKQLEWRDQINGDQSRMMIAHTVVKELKACLATKNLLLAKYRTKSIHHKTTESDVKALPASSSVPRFCQAKSTFEETPTLSTLLTKITRFAEVIREKDSIIGKLKETISNLNVKEKARECYELSVKDKVSNLIEEKERMLCHSQLKYEQMVKEKQKLENLLGDAQQRFNIKQREYDSLSETVSRLKKGLKSKSEEIDRLSATESELRRIKMSLSLERRVKEKLNKVVQESKAKLLKANDDAEKLQAEVLELRKSLNDVRGAKLVLEKKYCRANVKIKEMKIIIDEKCNGEDKKLHHNNKVSQKSMNNSLQKENSRHRKIIASCKMKAKLGQNGRSSSADSMECCKGNKGITKKTSCSVNTIENEMVECMKEEIRKLNDSIAMNKERIEKSEIDIHEIVDQCSTDKTLNPKQDVSNKQLSCTFCLIQLTVQL